MNTLGTLYFFTGKMGAGKSTKSREIAQRKNAVLLSEDEWLAALYPHQIKNFDDYLNYSQIIKPILKMHIQSISQVGSNVVMDFPGNTRKQRAWLLSIANEIHANHQLIYLNLADEQCLKQLKKRADKEPDRNTFDTKETFDYVSSFFEAPDNTEKLNIIEIRS